MSNSSGPMNVSLLPVTDESAQLLPDNRDRKYLMIQNNAESDVWINFGNQPAVADECMLLESGASWEPAHAPTCAVNALGSVSDPGIDLTIIEG